MNLKWGDIELILLAWGISIFFSSYFLSFMSTFYLRNGTPIYHREMPVAANGNVHNTQTITLTKRNSIARYVCSLPLLML